MADLRERQRRIDEALEDAGGGAAAEDPVVPPGEEEWVRCGEIQVAAATAPGELVALGIDCETAQRYAETYAADGSLPPGWDAVRDCGVSSLSCENDGQGFGVEDN